MIEDACQGVGGGYEGRKFGSIGHVGAFSFNYYKNMTAGEGGGVATSDEQIAKRARCAIDPCHFYWTGRENDLQPFAGNGGRASELMGAMLNVQLDRIDGIVGAMRAEKRRVVEATRKLGNLGLELSPMHSPDHDCAAHVMYNLPSAEEASRFVKVFPAVIAGKTGRHTYTEWDQVLMGMGAAHPAMNPYNHPDNAGCRRHYDKDMCARSLEILNRTVMVPTDPGTRPRRSTPSSTTSRSRPGWRWASMKPEEARAAAHLGARHPEVRHGTVEPTGARVRHSRRRLA